MSKLFKRMIALVCVISVALSFCYVPAFASEQTDIATIEVSGETVTLNMSFVNTYYMISGMAADIAYTNEADIRGKALLLTNSALETYNTKNDTEYTTEDIDVLKLSTSEASVITKGFSDFLKAKLVNLAEIDMGDAIISGKVFNYETNDTPELCMWYFGSDDSSTLQSVKKIILPKNLEVIGQRAFRGLSSLEEVVFPNTLTTVYDRAFANCTSLKELNYPDSLNMIISETVDTVQTPSITNSCDSLTTWSYHGNADGATYSDAFYSNLVNSFKNVNYTTVDLSGSTVTTEAALAIANKDSVTYLDLSNCPNIEYASANGDALYKRLYEMKAAGKTVLMPDNEATISVSDEIVTFKLQLARTYYGGASDIPDAIGAFLDAALMEYNTENATSITAADVDVLEVNTIAGAKLTYYFNRFFKKKLPQLTEIDLSDAEVTCKYYSNHTYPDNQIGDATRQGDDFYFGDNGTAQLTNIKKISLPKNLEVIGARVFRNLTTLEEIVFPNTVTTIHSNAFQNCSSLTTLNLPDSLVQIGDSESANNWMTNGSGITSWSYHGDANDEFYSALIECLQDVNYTSVDLSGSSISATQALELTNKSSITTLNLKDCYNIDLTTADGIALFERVEEMRKAGKTVLISDDAAKITVNDEIVTLDLRFAKTYYQTASSNGDCFQNENDILGKSLTLTNEALENYNYANNTNYSLSDIDVLKVQTIFGAKITRNFNSFIKEKLPQVVEIDLSNAEITHKSYSTHTNNETHPDNQIGVTNIAGITSFYFGEHSSKDIAFTNVKKISLPKNLEVIGGGTFKNLTTLEEVIIPDTVKEIYANAFQNCTSLKEIYLPDSLNLIYSDTQGSASDVKNMTGNCSSLISWSYNGTSGDDAFYMNLVNSFDSLEYTTVDLSGSAITSSAALVVANKSSIAYLDLSNCENIEYISDDGKALYEKLTALKEAGKEVYFPEKEDDEEIKPDPKPVSNSYANIEVSGDNITLNLVFAETYFQTSGTNSDCFENESDILGKSLTLTNSALEKFNNENNTSYTLADIDVLKVSTTDGAKITRNFNSFIKEKLPQIVEIDLSNAEITHKSYETHTNNETHPDNQIGVTNIAGVTSFYFGEHGSTAVVLTNVKKISLPKNLEVIGGGTFRNLKALEEIVFPDTVKEIYANAFHGCSALKKIEYPDSINLIHSAAQGSASDVKNMTYGCSALAEWSYNGSTSDAAFYMNLVNSFDSINYTKVDLSGSNITSSAALVVANKSSLAYLDLRNCENIEYTSTDGLALYAKLIALEKAGKEVYYPENPQGGGDPPEPVPVSNSYANIVVSGNTVTLELVFAETYYQKHADTTLRFGIDDDILCKSLTLTNSALATYNIANGTTFTLTDIDVLKVSTIDGAKVTRDFNLFFKEKLPQLVEIDMSKADVTFKSYVDHTDDKKYPDNQIGQTDVSGVISFYFGENSADAVKLTAIKKIVLPENLEVIGGKTFRYLSTLEEIVLPNTLEHIYLNAFQNCPSLKVLNLPDSLCLIGSDAELESSTLKWMTDSDEKLKEWSYHGSAEHSVDTDAFYKNLVNSFSNIKYEKVDLSGSTVTVDAVLLLKDTVNYLDLRNCVNLEYSSENGQALYNMLTTWINEGKTVYMPSKEELANKVIVSAKTNDRSMGTVKGSAVYEKDQLPKEHTFTAICQNGYELVGWQVDGENGVRSPGTANADGTYTLTLTITDATTVTGIFEIYDTDIPEGNKVSVKNGKLYLTLKNVQTDEEISLFTQILLKRYKQSTGVNYTAADIAAIEIITTENALLSKSFKDIFPSGFYENLKANLVELNLEKAKFKNACMPYEFVAYFSALTKVVLPENLLDTGEFAFSNCVSLKDIKLPDSVRSISWDCFKKTAIETINIPDNLKEFESGAFNQATNFKGNKDGIILLPDSIEIFNSLFGKMDELKLNLTDNSERIASGVSTMFDGTKVKGVEYHGEGSAALFSRLICTFDWRKAHYDFRGSGVTEKQLAMIPFTAPAGYDIIERVTYLDIRDCPIDYTTARGKQLKKKLLRFIEENPSVTVLWDEGIIRDKSYTVVEANIVVKENQTLEDALNAWSLANGNASISTITELTIITDANASLDAEDFKFLNEVLKTSLRNVDLSNAKIENDEIPAEAFSGAENLRGIILPNGLITIGEKAFFGTDLYSIVIPDTVKIIEDYAFGECYSLEGNLKLPNELEKLGNSVFADASLTGLEYHGPLDINLSENFKFSIDTIEYLDLRGCVAITENNFPLGWGSLKVAHLDYCSIKGVMNGKFYSSLVTMLQRLHPVFTVHNQCVPYDDLETMLKEDVFGKQHNEYPLSDVLLNIFDISDFNLWEVDSGFNIIVDSSQDTDNSYNNDNDNNHSSDDNNSDDDNDKDSTTKKKKSKKVVKYLKKKQNVETPNNSWIIYASVAGVVVLVGATVATVVLLKRRRKDEKQEVEKQ